MLRSALPTRWASALVVLSLAGAPRPALAAVPPNFVDQLVASVGGATALAFTPDGRLLIATQGGSLRVYQNGALVGTPALTFPSSQICANFERGLLGVAVDPDFANSQYIYLFYTFRNGAAQCDGSSVPKNRVSRFVLPPSNVVSLATETILVDNMPSPNGNHNGGDVKFGKDGYLYISVGEGGIASAARSEHILTGKILRITRTGGIPPTNPFQGAGTARCNVTGSTTAGNRCQETFVWGFRNPFRIAMDPNAAGTVLRINDVGQSDREEIDLAEAGVDYGWNCREGTRVNSTSGACNPTPPNMRDPIYEYTRGNVPGTTASGCAAITGGAFVPNGLWPGYDGTYIFGDYVCGWLFRLSASAPYAAADFGTNVGGVRTTTFGPFNATQALYYSNGSQVRRIFYSVGGNNPPAAVASANPLGGPLPFTTTLSAAGSSDPDPGNTLTYFWNFGDGSPETSTTSLTISHTYTSAGVFTATLRARDNNFAFSPPATVQIHAGNSPPVPVITFPAASDTFRVGQVVNLAGTATDAENGTLAANRLSWTVVLHHNTHTHPFLGPVTGSPVPMTCPAPEDLAATDTSYLEVRLTATDLDNLSSTVTRNFQPLKVPITIQTAPTGLIIPVNGFNQTGPSTFNSWADWVLNVEAPNQGLNGTNYTWTSWSDGGARSHAITTPSTAATYTATFQALPQLVLRYFTLPPCRLVDTRNPVGPRGGPALSAGGTRHFDLDGVCNIPATAKALSVNVTVAAPSAAGHLRLWEMGSLMPSTSVINFKAGEARANNAIVTLSSTGGASVFCGIAGTGSTHFVLDVTGYFE